MVFISFNVKLCRRQLAIDTSVTFLQGRGVVTD